MAGLSASAHLARAGQVRAWLADHAGDYLERLGALVQVRSVSADPTRRTDMRAAAEFVAAELRDAGLPDCEVAETGGHPVVLAARRDAGPDRPTIMVYLHYDVQPEGELAEWSVPPFEAVLRDGRLIGRGLADDKGPILMLCAALRGLAECGGDLPVNLIVLVDGEEEDGSASLPAFLDRRGDLAADLVAISDTSMLGIDRPSLVLATRGTRGPDRRPRPRPGGTSHGVPGPDSPDPAHPGRRARGRLRVPARHRAAPAVRRG